MEDFGSDRKVNKRFVGTQTQDNVDGPTECKNRCDDIADCVAWSSTFNLGQNYCYQFTSITSVEDDQDFQSQVKGCPSTDNEFQIPCYIKLQDEALQATGNIQSTESYDIVPPPRYRPSMGC